MRKICRVTFTNHSTEPLRLTLITNNISQQFEAVNSTESKKFKYDFTSLNNQDGNFQFLVQHVNSGIVDTFAHGYFTSGGLCNYLEVTYTANAQLAVKASN